MKASLAIQQSQALAITPKLRQAIALLQCPSFELEEIIKSELEKNPFLETLTSHENKRDETDSHPESYHETFNEIILASKAELSSLNYDHDNHFNLHHNRIRNDGQFDHNHFINQHADETTLQQHLLWQMQLLPLSIRDKLIATTIIDAIDDNGYLENSISEIQEALLKIPEFKIPEMTVIEKAEIEAVLHSIQQFEPKGIAARNLSECLTIQLAALQKNTPYLEQTQVLVLNYLQLLAKKDYASLKRRLKLGDDGLKGVLKLLSQLNPKPGSLISAKHLDYIIPDVIVWNQNNRLMVELNMAHIPKLRVNKEYAHWVTQQAETQDKGNPLQQYLSEAEWFLKSLETRHETLLKVCGTIVEMQAGFFKFGEEQMRALNLREVANAAGFHESTVSRITHQKYMLSPRGIFELKYFFSNPVQNKEGETLSSVSIRALIKKIIQQEKAENPLSDQQIVEILGSRGIHLHRRTVTKYRMALNIAASNERRMGSGLSQR